MEYGRAIWCTAVELSYNIKNYEIETLGSDRLGLV
jgi:hypothetical protein